MKKIFLILMIGITSYISYGQLTTKALEDFPQYHSTDNIYFKDLNNSYNKFIGLWEFNDGTHHLKLRLYKVSYVNRGGGIIKLERYRDEIHSFIEYKVKENGIWDTKYNTFPYPNATSGGCNQCIYGVVDFNSNELYMEYNEPSPSCERFKSATLSLTYGLNGSIAQLIWQRKMDSDNRFLMEIPCPDGQMIDMSDFIIPANMVLTKIAD